MTNIQIPGKLVRRWRKFWLARSGISCVGRMSTMLASIGYPPHYKRISLARMHPNGYTSLFSKIAHDNFSKGNFTFIDDRVLIFQAEEGGEVTFGNGVSIMRESILQTGQNGKISIGDKTCIQPRCVLSAYAGDIVIGEKVQMAPNCSIYPYNHSFEHGKPIWDQPLFTKGGVVIGDDAWIGVNVTILDNVRIGVGAVIGAGTVVNIDIPDEHIAFGVPARVIRRR